MANVAAVILAGGRGERLGGVVKAHLEVGGITLLDRVGAVLAPIADPVLVASGAIEPSRLSLRRGQIAIPDAGAAGTGPVAGVEAAAAWLLDLQVPPEFLLTVAVDTPFLPGDYAKQLLAAMQTGVPGLVVHYAGQDYPTNALWRLQSLADALRDPPPRSLWRLAAACGALPYHWPEHPDGDPFTSVNTPTELAAANARARR
jgi:molybdenum cofactor guanylyltransferase